MLIAGPAVKVELFTTCTVPAFRPVAGDPETNAEAPFNKPTVAPESDSGVLTDGPPGTFSATLATLACVPPHSFPQFITTKWLSSTTKTALAGRSRPALAIKTAPVGGVPSELESPMSLR